MFRVTSIVLCFFSAVFLSDTASGKEEAVWAEYSSKNFILFSDADPALARETIIKLEKYRFVLGQITGLDLENDNAPPLKLYAFRTTDSFQHAIRTGDGILGYYSDNLQSPLAALSLEPREDFWEHDGLETIFHEYNHYILRRYSRMDYPQWYSEGFAEYTSTVEFDGEVAIVGKPAVPRFMVLRRAPSWKKLKDLMHVKSRVGGRWDPPIWSVQTYAQGWLLTHFLHHSEKYSGVLPKYLTALNTNGVDEGEAFVRVFGDRRDALADELKEYWHGQSLPYFAFDFTGKMPGFTFETRELPAAEADILPLEVRILSKTIELDRHQKWIRSELLKALRAEVRPVDMLYCLALQAYVNERWERAIGHADAAIELDPDNVRVLEIKARATRRKAEEDGTLEATMPEIGRLFGRVVKLDSRYVLGLVGYAKLALTEGQTVTPAVLQAARAARMQAPRNSATIKLEADLLEKAGKYGEARDLLEHAIEWSFVKDDYKAYQKQYDRILKKEASAAP
ncbi:tetratricopeptide repeat protein [Kordiimonas aestuarii]|uniref:tetratricopeptide repeat protein n=1 Tax=Kordiimonas aestuarii TaxID=1005925 RepID=UPI0021D38F51|nr:hypothetical protein [Kordiimonas aestuarii]